MYNLVAMEISFGEWLRDRRKSRRFTQEQLSSESGVSASYISTLERSQPHSITGAKLRPEPDKVKSLADALGEDVDEALRIAGYAAENSSNIPESVKDAFAREGKLSPNDEVLIANFIGMLKQNNKNE